MDISTAIASAADSLAKAGVTEPRKEAASLIAFVLQSDAAFVIAHSDDQLAANQKMIFDACVRRRANREPLQYITGRQEFWGLDFEVTPGVLIPRPETEILVEASIEVLSALENPRFCEAGVGSGCISISILHSVEKAAAVGTDLSKAALAVAARNATKHGVEQRLELIQTDLFTGLDSTFDLIVTNPPYIPEGDIDELQPEVRDFEPREALSGGSDGLDVLRRVVNDAHYLLSAGGVLLMEIGCGQSGEVEAMFDKAWWASFEFLADLQNIPRVACARLK